MKKKKKKKKVEEEEEEKKKKKVEEEKKKKKKKVKTKKKEGYNRTFRSMSAESLFESREQRYITATAQHDYTADHHYSMTNRGTRDGL